MTEYIERITASNKLYDVYEYVKRNIIADGKPVDASLVKNIMLRFEKALNAVPNADVAPVHHGEWIVCGDGDNVPWMCSHCGKTTASKYKIMYGKYCPNCGAKMDGDRL